MKRVLLTLVIALTPLLAPSLVTATAAADTTGTNVFQVCDNLPKGGQVPDICKEVKNPDEKTSTINRILKLVIDFLSVIVGVAAVIMMIVNGMRMVFSDGDAEDAKHAREGLIYAAVGLILTALAQVFVAFVLNTAG